MSDSDTNTANTVDSFMWKYAVAVTGVAIGICTLFIAAIVGIAARPLNPVLVGALMLFAMALPLQAMALYGLYPPSRNSAFRFGFGYGSLLGGGSFVVTGFGSLLYYLAPPSVYAFLGAVLFVTVLMRLSRWLDARQSQRNAAIGAAQPVPQPPTLPTQPQ